MNCRNGEGQTPLMVAAQHNSKDVIDYLLSVAKVDLEARDNNGMTALLKAASEGQVEAAQVLGQHNADIFAVDKVRSRAKLMQSPVIA